jgi:cytochrome c biogenesis protein CcmG, thiol:disulfide interchange protein DsbE
VKRLYLLPLGLLAVLAVFLWAGLRHAPEKGVVQSPLVGKPAPGFSLPQLGDPAVQVSSKDLAGKWYLLNVWGSWCVTCAEEHAMLLKMAQQHAVPLIGMDWNDVEEDAQKWLAERGNPYQVVGVDRDGRGAIDWGVTAAPESFLVNPQGIIMYKCTGEITPRVWEQEILPRIAGKIGQPGQTGGVRDTPG